MIFSMGIIFLTKCINIKGEGIKKYKTTTEQIRKGRRSKKTEKKEKHLHNFKRYQKTE